MPCVMAMLTTLQLAERPGPAQHRESSHCAWPLVTAVSRLCLVRVHEECLLAVCICHPGACASVVVLVQTLLMCLQGHPFFNPALFEHGDKCFAAWIGGLQAPA